MYRPFSSMARTAPAVPSGRSVTERPPLSSKVYICFSTTSQDALDLEICKHFEAQLKLVNPQIKTVLKNGLDIDETIQSFANLDYLIGMRYHACLLALKYGTPTLALSYDEKVEKIAKRFDLPCSFLDDEDKLEQYFKELKAIQPQNLKTKAKECVFDFSKILNKIEE